MKNTELRIGNLVDHNYGISTVNMIRGNDIGLYDSGLALWGTTIDKIKPIPLTEEWLIKFGFGKSLGYDFGNSLKQVHYFFWHGVCIIFSDEFWYSVKKYDGGTSENYEPEIEIKSVHQLQNLIFALTGLELEPK